MARKLALILLVLVLGLALWLWKGSTPSAVPLGVPATERPNAPSLDSAQTENAPELKREEVATSVASTQSTLLVVTCRAKETGAPLAGQTVHLSELNPPRGAIPVGTGTHGRLNEMLTTGGDGRVEYELPPGVPTRLSSFPEERGANAPSRREIEPLAAGERRELVIQLATLEDAHFYARVIARETKQPIAAADVHGGPREVTTDADGRFDVSNSSWSMQRLSILALGYAETVVMAQPGHETPEKAMLIELERSCMLVGLLQGAVDDAQRGRLRMVVRTEGYRLTTQDSSGLGALSAERDHTWRAEFDTTGRAEIVGLVPNAPLRVSVLSGATHLLELTEPITIRPGATREIELKVADTCKLTGIVRDDAGAVVPGLTLWLLRTGTSPRLHLTSVDADDRVGDAKTDELGRFTIPKVTPGTWRLGPEAKMYPHGAPIPADATAPFAILLEIPAGEAKHQVELVVHRGLTITGKVLDPDDKPVNDAGIQARTGPTWLGTSCGADGTFVLGPLQPGTYTLEASPSFHKELARSETLQAEAGARDVVLRLRRGGGLSGRVVDAATGEGVASTVSVSQPGNKTEYIYSRRSNPDGTFEFGGLLPGTYALAATLPDGRAGVLRAVDLPAGTKASDLVISVSAGARLRVRYAGEQKFASVRFEQEGVRFSGDGIEKGTSKMFTAPAGSVKVVCRLGGSRKEIVRELTLKTGEEQELVINDED